MRIGIDIRCLAEGKTSGVEEYTIRTLRHLFDNDKKNKFILFSNSFRGDRSNLKWLEDYPDVELRDYRFPNKLLNFSLWFFQWPKIDRMIGGVDLFFVPNIVFIALSSDCRKVLTIHDLSFELFPETFSAKRRLWHYLVNPRKMVQEYDRILAVSQSTQSDLVDYYHVPKEKIVVSHPPLDQTIVKRTWNDKEKAESIRKSYGMKKNFILYLGTIEPRKNIEGLVQAYGHLRDQGGHDDLQLVVAGGKGWKTENIFRTINSSPYKRDILITDYVQPSDKPWFYRMARIFVYPSFFEGFGYPPIEAMAAGTPVVTSNCSSLPEAVGAAAVLIDPYRPQEIAIAMQKILDEPGLAEYLSQAGVERARQLFESEKGLLEKIIN